VPRGRLPGSPAHTACIPHRQLLARASLLRAATPGAFDNLIYTKPSWAGAWAQVKNSGFRTTIDQMPNGTILGVDSTGALRYKSNSTQPDWKPAPSSLSLFSTKTMNDGTILGVARDG
jgi:hypothetical protein